MARSVALLALCSALALPAFGASLVLRSNDVVAFVGGSDVAAAQFTGHLEALLAAAYPGTRFRNFGWEGDTVFAQPREINFPPTREHLRRAGATVVLLQFGRAEALTGREPVTGFSAALEKIVLQCLSDTQRVVLVTPIPFERPLGLLPDLSSRNVLLAQHAEAIRDLARQRSLPVVDLFQELGGTSHRELLRTHDGLSLTQVGHGQVAAAFLRQLDLSEVTTRTGELDADGRWANTIFEALRQRVVEKNQHWFNYWRPQNWAFLGGDRVSQPSSRDHRDPKVRWFPAEMEKFVPLIRDKEMEMEQLAATLRRTSR
jgi:hypothetical protein